MVQKKDDNRTPKDHVIRVQKNNEDKKETKVEMIGRRLLVLDGVTSVEAFDEEQILLKTKLGLLLIVGEKLNITNLNLEEEQLDVNGRIDGLEYVEEKGAKFKNKSKNIISRLLR